MIGFGVVGLGLEAASVPLGPFFRGLVQSLIVEKQLRRSLMSSDGSVAETLHRQYALLFLAIGAATLLWPAVAARMQRTRVGAGP